MYIYYTIIRCIYFIHQNEKNENKKRGWHILKIEQYENANKLQKFLLLFTKENVEFKARDITKVTHYRVLFGVRYITKEYWIY